MGKIRTMNKRGESFGAARKASENGHKRLEWEKISGNDNALQKFTFSQHACCSL